MHPKCSPKPLLANIVIPIAFQVEKNYPPFHMNKKAYIYERCLHRGSYMSAHVLLILLNELGKRNKVRGLLSILSLFRTELNKFT